MQIWDLTALFCNTLEAKNVPRDDFWNVTKSLQTHFTAVSAKGQDHFFGKNVNLAEHKQWVVSYSIMDSLGIFPLAQLWPFLFLTQLFSHS